MNKNRCRVCNRPLKDDVSKARGIGPKCFERLIKLDKSLKVHKIKIRKVKAHKIKQIEGQINMFNEVEE